MTCIAVLAVLPMWQATPDPLDSVRTANEEVAELLQRPQSPERDAADAGWRQELERLPEEIRPDYDLWPGIAGRLAPRTGPWWLRLGQEMGLGVLWRPVLAVAAAALVLAVGSTLWSDRQELIPPVPVVELLLPPPGPNPALATAPLE